MQCFRSILQLWLIFSLIFFCCFKFYGDVRLTVYGIDLSILRAPSVSAEFAFLTLFFDVEESPTVADRKHWLSRTWGWFLNNWQGVLEESQPLAWSLWWGKVSLGQGCPTFLISEQGELISFFWWIMLRILGVLFLSVEKALACRLLLTWCPFVPVFPLHGCCEEEGGFHGWCMDVFLGAGTLC